jgi:uncharacterized protein YidB (DUF937 family)
MVWRTREPAEARLARPSWNPGRTPAVFVRLEDSEMSSRGFPSMTALLGLLAIAGYQNRDKIAEMLGSGQGRGAGGAPGGQPGRGTGSTPGVGQPQSGLGGLLEGLGGAGAGGLLSGGLGELIERFKQSGHGDVADSWVGTGPNRDVAPHQLEQAIGPDVIATLSQRTGLSRDEILARLTRELPHAVDKYTPEGRLPSESDFQRT